MSRLFGPIFQMAYVVPTLEPILDHMTRVLGVGPFFLFPLPLQLSRLEIDGVATDRHAILSAAALAYSGDTMIEICVPGDDPNPYRRFLEQGRAGLHHVGTEASDYDAQMAAARAAGHKIVLEGEASISRFAYIETDMLFPGTMVELIEMRPEMKAAFAMIKAAAVDWDGRDPVRAL